MRQIMETAGAGDLILGRLFAVLHDARRRDEHADPDHGRRAAEWAVGLRGRHFDLDDGGRGASG